jgi:antitoxin VapB
MMYIQELSMPNEVRAKTFKSGNSVALRLPKALGIKEGVEMKVREEQGHYIVEPVKKEKKKLDFSFLEGRSLGLKPLRPEERLIESELDWEGKLLKRD